MPISPVIINVMPTPFKGAGILEYFILSRIAAIPTIASHQPMPEPSANDTVSPTFAYSSRYRYEKFYF
jgi:hypothetical protein